MWGPLWLKELMEDFISKVYPKAILNLLLI